MNCRDVEERLDACVEETLSGEECRELQKHVDSCAACRRLLSVARGEADFPADDGRGFAASVLERTSGSPCVRARDLLCDHVDGQLDTADSELLRRHLDHCPACAALSVSLSELRIELPAMADIQPGPFFSVAVIRRLSALGNRPADRQTRIRRWWASLVRRPRFSWEAAYIGTLLLVLAFGNPFSQSYGSSSRLSVPATAWAHASRRVPQVWETFADKGGQTADDVVLEISGALSAAEQFASAVEKKIAEVNASVIRMLEQAMRRLSQSIRRMKPTAEVQRTAESRGVFLPAELFLRPCVNADERTNRYGG
jgi:anti-sigma factor RsiW